MLKNTGPKIFMRRLSNSGIDDTDIELLNPDLNSIRNRSTSLKILVGRLDGTSYYDFSSRNLENFLKLRGFNKSTKILSYFPDLKSRQFLNILINRHLDRTCQWLLKNATGLIFQSKLSLKMHKKFLNFDEKSKPFDIIHNGVDVNFFHPSLNVNKSFGFPAVIISASKYRLHKRLQEAIKLINYLSFEFPEIKLNILGEMDFLTQNCIKNFDKSRCIFHGKINPDNLPFFYQNTHIQLHLSIFDPCPNVVVEGLASGLPVITPYESGARELVGKMNSDWVVKEHLELKHLELHRHDKIPAINLQRYGKVFKKIFYNLKSSQNSARERAESKLDIKYIASKYQDFYLKLKQKYNDQKKT